MQHICAISRCREWEGYGTATGALFPHYALIPHPFELQVLLLTGPVGRSLRTVAHCHILTECFSHLLSCSCLVHARPIDSTSSSSVRPRSSPPGATAARRWRMLPG